MVDGIIDLNKSIEKILDRGIAMKRWFVFILTTVFFSFNALAGTGEGKVLGLLPYVKSNGEKVLFISVESKTGSPSCNVTNRFALSDTHGVYNELYSAILAAYHTGSKVKGANSCNVWSNSEDVSQICFGTIAC